jgi:hypothetical protein
MKSFFSFLLLAFVSICATAQEKHFVFIQSDNKQPFYVTVNGKLYSSSSSGYVIVPKLNDGTYNLSVGFAQNAFPEQNFDVVINKKDLGYNLKNFTDKGWGLFNLQTLDVAMAGSSNTDNVAKALSENGQKLKDEPLLTFNKKKPETKTSTTPLAVAASDNNPVASSNNNNNASPDTATAVKNTQEVVASTSSKTKKNDGQESVENPADVKKVSEVNGAEGVKLSYVETTGKKTDTIQVVIPTNNSVASGTTDNAQPQSTVETAKTETKKSESPKSDVKFLDININSKKDKSEAEAMQKSAPASISANCKEVATDEDYGKLRKKMANESTDDEMIAEARKFYKNKCFLTAQVKALSTLFLSDEGRFKFFEASYASVADAGEYSSLQTEFIDPAYVDRFKAIVK